MSHRLFTPYLMLRTNEVMSLAQEEQVRAALSELREPLRDGQAVELAGINFTVVNL